MNDSQLAPLLTEKYSGRINLPTLTGNAQELFTLASDARKNVSMLELLAKRDPVASAKLLATANPEVSARVLATYKVRDAIVAIGTETAYEILLQSAALGASLEGADDVEPDLIDFTRKYLLSMSATVAQMRKRSRVPTHPALETVAGFGGLGLALLLMDKPQDQPAMSRLRRCAYNNDFKLHSYKELHPWLRTSAVILNSWGTETSLVQMVLQLHKEIVAVHAGTLSSSQCQQETAVIVSAQWLLSETATDYTLELLWNALGAAKRTGLAMPGSDPAQFKMTVY